MAKVSVIITSYNYEKYIRETINSVLNQTINDWELIIIDDNSTDNSIDIIMEFANKDTRIQVIRNCENLGLKESIKTALLAATGKWIAFLESDDLWEKDYLEKKLALANQYPNVGFIYNNVKFFDSQAQTAEKKYSSLINKNNNRNFPKNMFYNFGYENPVLTMSSVMIKKQFLENIDFSTPIDKLLDWYLYIQIAQKTDFYYLKDKLTLWRQHEKSYISQNNKIKYKFANISAYDKLYKQSPWNLGLLLFIILSTIRMCFKRLIYYISKKIM